MRLDLENIADKPSNQIPGFYEGLVETLPSLEEHLCSLAWWFLNAGARRHHDGTYCGTWLWNPGTGWDSGLWSYSRDRYPGVYQVVIEYLDEEAGRYAARAAVRLSKALLIQAVISNRI